MRIYASKVGKYIGFLYNWISSVIMGGGVMDKAIIRFFAVQMYEPFIADIEPIQKDKKISHLIDQLSALSVSSIILPANFEMAVHKNIVVQAKDIAPESFCDSVVLDHVWVNWVSLKSIITSALKNDIHNSEELSQHKDKDQFLMEEKRKATEKTTQDQVIDLQAELISTLLEKSFPLIEKYFQLDRFGLPSLKLLELMMNRIIGGKLEIQENEVDRHSATFSMGEDNYTVNLGPRFHKIYDMYALLQSYEIHYLRRKLEELNPEISLADEMEKDGYDKHQYILEKIINKQDPVYYISFDADFKKTHFKKDDVFLKDFEVFSRNFKETLFEFTSSKLKTEERLKTLHTVLEHINRYFDLRFNKKMSYESIQNNLGLPHSVWRDIQTLAEKIGFIDENTQMDQE